MYDAILIPTDGSEGALDALDHAIAIGRDHDATVHALFVVNRRIYVAAADDEQAAVRERLRADGESAVDTIVERVEAAGLAAEGVVRDGVPHREILSYAEEAEIDLVAMGTHGHTGRDRLVSLGSVAERIVENSAAPVLTVRISEAAAGAESGDPVAAGDAAGEGD